MDNLRKRIKVELQARKKSGEFTGTMKSAYDCLKNAGYEWTPEVKSRVRDIIKAVGTNS